ncbi:hypothetical protein ABIC08_006348 [Bradyrhizobium sp. RT9b]|uniref:hypothetical protein n=1 Tax=unclassified Bradyrhizobium TaxID=2631580 RepID=UPI00339293CA
MHCKDSANPRTSRSSAGQSAQGARTLERVRKSAPVEIVFPHPLSWWRTRRPERFKEVDIHIARYVLSKSAVIGEPHWHLGAAGNLAIALNVAMRASKRQSLLSLDLAMTAVLCLALEGQDEAKLFLSAMLLRRSEIDEATSELSDEWLDFSPTWI